MKQEYYSSGKLLITGEYMVLKGAEAFALPTKFGQSLEVESSREHKGLKWKSLTNEGQVWFEAEFALPSLIVQQCSSQKIADDLKTILYAAQLQNPSFLDYAGGVNTTTRLEFPQNWGLGSSATLICNIAKWAEVDAFALSDASFGGSGYDIAVGMVGSELIYSVPPAWDSFVYHPPFRNKLFFVHLNKKQNSRAAVQSFNQVDVLDLQIQQVSQITRTIATCTDFNEFQMLVTQHEKLLSELLQEEPVKLRYFNDFPYAIKSLGAWGGDFILACGDEQTPHYFREKGYSTVLRYDEIIR